MAKYDPLKQALMRDRRQTVLMSFSEIEKLVGPLPATSHANQWWWGNEENKIKHYAQCRAWTAADYDAVADLKAQQVTFRRR